MSLDDMPGFLMSFSGVPGFDMNQWSQYMGAGGGMGGGTSMMGANMGYQGAMALMRTVGARAGMPGTGVPGYAFA